MAAYSSYAYRGKPHENEWNNAAYCDDHVCRTVIVDSNGREKIAIGCSPYPENVESYVVQSESTERVISPHYTEYRHGSPTPKKKASEYGHEKWRRPSSPDRHPPELDDFFNGVQIETSRPHNNKYGATNWRPNPNPGYGGYTVMPSGGNYDYYRNDSPPRNWERPVKHETARHSIASPGGRDTKMGLPTNSIEQALDYLKGRNAKIGGVNGGGHGKPYASPRRYEAEDAPVRPSPPWQPTLSPSPPATHRGYAHHGVIDSNEAAKIYGGKIVRI